MGTLMLTIVFLLSYGSERIYGKDCDDCTPFWDCKEAVNLVSIDKSAECQQLVRNAFCGIKYRRGQKTIKVCCSEFKGVQPRPTEAPRDLIETHRNANLLPKECQDLDNKRIINGNVAAMYELPFMALIAYNTGYGKQFLCGGSIINSRYILTAAHCIKEKRMAGVRIGELDVRYEVDCDADMVCESHIEDIDIEEYIVHKGYKPKSLIDIKHDIALLRLKREIDFSYKNAAPVCLPIAKELRKPLINDEMGLVAGWGVTETLVKSPILMKVKIPILTNDTCRVLYNKNNTGEQYKLVNEFCAGEYKKDSCGGDSGGPFVIERLYNHVTSYFQYGVVSRGPRQCGSIYPGIYTNVMDHMDWILDNIRP